MTNINELLSTISANYGVEFNSIEEFITTFTRYQIIHNLKTALLSLIITMICIFIIKKVIQATVKAGFDALAEVCIITVFLCSIIGIIFFFIFWKHAFEIIELLSVPEIKALEYLQKIFIN